MTDDVLVVDSLVRRFGDLTDRVCCYFPGYDVSLDQVSALAGGLAGGM